MLSTALHPLVIEQGGDLARTELGRILILEQDIHQFLRKHFCFMRHEEMNLLCI